MRVLIIVMATQLSFRVERQRKPVVDEQTAARTGVLGHRICGFSGLQDSVESNNEKSEKQRSIEIDYISVSVFVCVCGHVERGSKTSIWPFCHWSSRELLAKHNLRHPVHPQNHQTIR